MSTESVDLGRALAAQREARTALIDARAALRAAQERVEAATAAYNAADAEALRAQAMFNDSLLGAMCDD